MRVVYPAILTLILTLFVVNLSAVIAVVAFVDGSEVEGTLSQVRKHSISLVDASGEQTVFTEQDSISFRLADVPKSYTFPLVYRNLPPELQAIYKVDMEYTQAFYDTRSFWDKPFSKSDVYVGPNQATLTIFGKQYLDFEEYNYLMVGAYAWLGKHNSYDVDNRFSKGSLDSGMYEGSLKVNMGYENLLQLELRNNARLGFYRLYGGEKGKNIHYHEKQLVFKLSPTSRNMRNNHGIFVCLGFGRSDFMRFSESTSSLGGSNYHWKDGSSYGFGLEYIAIGSVDRKSESQFGYSYSISLEYHAMKYKVVSFDNGDLDDDTLLYGMRLGFSTNFGFISGKKQAPRL